jgi:large subunit ribosomal protein L23
MNIYEVIKQPLVTEKSSTLKESARTLAFRVAVGANKIEIKQAVEKLLGVKVERVRTSVVEGKLKRQGRFVGRRADWKKAYVTLRKGEKMPEYIEGA